MSRTTATMICGMPVAACRQFLRRTLREDVGRGDVTSQAVVPPQARAGGAFIVKSAGRAAGLPLLRPLFKLIDPRCSLRLLAKDGAAVTPGQSVAVVQGPASALLAGERVALNLLQHLCGVATLTARFVQQARGSRATILDTRKTLPGLRGLEKYAVRMGGGANHRMRLDDQVLIKDNHLALLGGGVSAIGRALAACAPLKHKRIRVEVEVRSLAEAIAAAQAGADIVMLDNMSPAQMRRAVQAVSRACQAAGPPIIEASGGVTLRNVAAVARSGVDWISVGALTHSAPGLDISFELEPHPRAEHPRGARTRRSPTPPPSTATGT